MDSQATFDEKMQRVEWLAHQDEMAAMTLPTRGQCVVDDKTAVMDREYFEALGEYSMSLPTGAYLGKRWKRDLNGKAPHWRCDKCHRCFVGWPFEGNRCADARSACSDRALAQKSCDGVLGPIEVPPEWRMGEFYDIGRMDEVGIRWRKIVVV